ncbi:MAG: GIY-YIG nuclease family protein [Desulfobulbaceae bacterium]|uniref:GIY-YIG nuclease family protein n=1 Tax=Candidatus Desulfatifera sulfidica TaxID=2841691 RepID=A0A8J6N6C6_9BACT|nr:GIY-YIG nuclease family protein [Candidatus Desulfatifera sulfidica]
MSEPPDPNSWHVYILLCRDQTLYTGITTDLRRRLHEHNHTGRAARYTRCRRPVELVYSEAAASRSAALKREYQIRRLSAIRRKQLIREHGCTD